MARGDTLSVHWLARPRRAVVDQAVSSPVARRGSRRTLPPRHGCRCSSFAGAAAFDFLVYFTHTHTYISYRQLLFIVVQALAGVELLFVFTVPTVYFLMTFHTTSNEYFRKGTVEHYVHSLSSNQIASFDLVGTIERMREQRCMLDREKDTYIYMR